MISVSRFKKVFLILTAFVCVIASVSMKAKADYAPMTVIKTPSLNTAMKQGDIIIDNLSDENIDIKINDTSHFSLKKDAIAGETVAGAGQHTYNVGVTTDSTVTYPNSIEFKDPFEVTFREAAHDKRGAAIDVTIHFNFVKFVPSPKSPGSKFNGDFIFNMYTDIHDGMAPCIQAPGEPIRNVETIMDITTSMKYSENGKAPKGNYLTKYCDLDQPGSMDTFADYNAYPPESIWLLDGYSGNAYVSSDTTLNQTAWEEYSGRYFAATACDADNTIAATRSSVLAYADASSSRYRWYGYGCGTLVLVNKTGSKLTPEISTEKNVSTVYGGNTHTFNVTETGGTSGICEIKSDFNYVRSDDMPNSWSITDTFPTGVMTAPQAEDVRVYTKPLMDVISDDGTELPDASGYKSGTTEITSQVSISRDSDGKLTVSSTNYDLVKAKRVYVEFSAPIKPWNSIASADKNGTSTKEYLNSTTTTIKTTDQTSTKASTAPFSVRLNVSPHISIVKTPHLADSNGNGKADTGEKVSYTFSIRNDGNSSLSNIRLTDSLLGFTDRKVADSIAIGGTKEYSAPEAITVTADQARNGKIDNTATVKGTPPSGMSDVTATGKATVPTVAPAPKLTLEKTVDRKSLSSAESKVGAKLTYTFKVTNAGNVNIGNISINDKLSGVSAIKMSYPTGDGILAPGASATGTATYSLTNSDIERQGVTNTAQASGTDKATGNAVKSNESSVTTSVVQSAGLSIAKTVDKTSLSAVETRIGAKLSYGFTVTNTGNVAIKGISIDDRLNGLGDIKMSYPSKTGELAPGEKATGKASYSITNADILAGVVTNTAKAVGKNATTGASVESGKSTVTTRLVKTPSIKIEKTADPTHIAPIDAVAGKEISYSFKITNTGNVNLGDIAIEDSMKDLGTVSPAKKSLVPGESTTARATHRVTPDDIEAGTVTNTAKATGSAGGAVIKSSEATATTSIEKAVSRMSFEKTVDRKQLSGNEAKAGTTLTYSFKISNDGNIPINGVSIDDGLHGLSSISIDWHGHDGTIPAGSSVTGTATYRVTQEDVDAGKVDNSATASGTDAHGGKLSKTSTVSTKIERTGKLETVKSVDTKSLTGDRAKAGTALTYTVTVRNTGNVTLRNVTCDDSMKEIGRIALDRTELSPGAVASGTATHTVTQADVDAGTVVNSASSSADSPDASKVVSNRFTVSTFIESLPQLTVAKTAGRTHIPADEERVGEVIPYSLTVSNTGNVTVSGIELEDALAAKSLKVDWGGNASHTLAPGQSVPASASYAIADTDVDNGIVENTAQAGGKAPNGSSVRSNVAKAATTIEKAEPALALVKTGTEQVTGDDVKPGHEVEFDFELENIGNTTLKGISVKDALRGIGDIELERDELAAGEKTSGKATYRLTQDDIDAGFVKNSATAMAKTPTDVDVESNESSHTVTIVGFPSLSIEKKVDRETVSGTKSELRKTELTYSFTVTNTGTTTVSGIEIDDGLEGLGEIKFGEKKSAPTDTDAVDTDADGDDAPDGNGETADTAAGEDGNAGDATDDDDADGDDDASDGEESGGKGSVSDDKGIVLAPGESIDATATYRLSDSDIEAGTVLNRAKAKGTLPNGDDIVSDDSEAVTKITVEPDAVDLMQTGMTVAIPAAIAIAGASVIVSMAIRRRNRR